MLLVQIMRPFGQPDQWRLVRDLKEVFAVNEDGTLTRLGTARKVGLMASIPSSEAPEHVIRAAKRLQGK